MKIPILTFALILCFSFGYAQEHLEVEGSARIQQDLTIEGLAGSGTRNVVVDTNGKLLVDATGKSSVISVHAASFKPSGNNEDFSRLDNYLPHPGTGIHKAPLQLPHGARLDSVRVHYRDSSTSANLFFGFDAHDASTDTGYGLASFISSGAPSPPFTNVSRVEGINLMPIVWDPVNLGISTVHIFYTEL